MKISTYLEHRYFFNEMRVKKIISFFASVRDVDKEYLAKLIDKLDLDLTKRFGALSFGNKKKVGIVVALMHQPELLILDEPTSGLDPLIQANFLELIMQAKQNGTTILLSSHVLSEIEKVCDKVALIKEGKIMFTKTIAEIKKGEHKKLSVMPPNSKLDLGGLSYLKNHNGESLYSYMGDVNHLIDYLSNFRFLDVNLRNVELEEVFSVYYKKEGE